MGKLRFRVTLPPCGHTAQVQRLGLSLFIDLQVEMCRFDGANPPNPSPSWATITPNAQEKGMRRGLGQWGGAPRVPGSSMADTRKTELDERPASAVALGEGDLCTRSSSVGVPAAADGSHKMQAESVVSTWLPQKPRPAHRAWECGGCRPGPDSSGSRPLPPPALRRCPAGPAATSSPPKTWAGARAGLWARVQVPRAGIHGATC